MNIYEIIVIAGMAIACVPFRIFFYEYEDYLMITTQYREQKYSYSIFFKMRDDELVKIVVYSNRRLRSDFSAIDILQKTDINRRPFTNFPNSNERDPSYWELAGGQEIREKGWKKSWVIKNKNTIYDHFFDVDTKRGRYFFLSITLFLICFGLFYHFFMLYNYVI